MTPLILAAAAIAIAAVLYLYRRARRLAADPCRVSAELDAANAAIAGNHWTWERRANAALHELDLAIEDRNDEARLRVELVRAMAEASDVLEDERDAARGLRGAAEARADWLADQIVGLEAAIAQVVGDRDAHAARCVELARRVSELEQHETSATIAAWQNETFGAATTDRRRVERTADLARHAFFSAISSDLTIPRPNLSRAIRAAEELAELIELLVVDDLDPRAPIEVADIDIVLRGIDAAHGVERADLVSAKMKINRARRWTLTGDGHGQHVDGGAP